MKPTIQSIARMCGVSRGTVDRVLNDRPYVSADVRKKVLRAKKRRICRMKPTIQSIARMCGVSRGTVDRVLNDRPYVSADVRKKVLRAVQTTGYVHPRKNAPSDRGVQIGFLIAKWESGYFRQQVERGIRRAERVLRPGELSLHIETMGSRSDREYIQRIDALLAAGANGIILNAADNVLLRSKIEQLAARGIPVVTYNSDLPTSSRVCHVGQDLAKSGQVAAGLLARSLGAQDHILAITGNLEFQSHRRRVESFCAVGQDLAKSGQVAAGLLARSLGAQDHILAITGNLEFQSHRRRVESFCAHAAALGIESDRVQLVECFERYDLTYNAILHTLQQDSKVRGVYMGTESVPACMDAIKKAGLKYKVHVVANDLTQPAIRGLKNGLLDFVVEQDFSAQAYEAILILYALLAHNRSPKSPLRYVETSIYTKELL